MLNFGGGFCEHHTDESQVIGRLVIYHGRLGHLPEDFHFEPGLKLNAGAPRARLCAGDEGPSSRWTIYGFWSAEQDVCELDLRGLLRPNGMLASENMGAYTWELAFQFEPDRGVEVRFIGGDSTPPQPCVEV
ncbi:MAG: hypothetical protein HC902_01655 [Calothrix sp. SM1_5_4]|nr:hypothetical protein [Calothrix sp. SM1_5_4]